MAKQTFLKKAAAVLLIALLIISSGCTLVETIGGTAGGLVITEVASANASSLTHETLGNPDWVELHNSTDKEIMLAEYILDEAGNNQFQFPEITLGVGEYIILYCCDPPETPGADDETADEAEAPASSGVGALCTGFKLSKSGTELALLHQGNPVQEIVVPALLTDISYGEMDGQWGYYIEPTPGAVNSGEVFASLEELQSGEDAALRITEVMPAAAEVDGDEWAEILNTGEKPVLLGEFYITDNEDNATKAQLPDSELAPGERILVHFGGQKDGDIPFRIGRDETMLMITNRFGSEVDQFAWDGDIMAGFSAGLNEENDVVYYMTPTPGEANEGKYLGAVGFEEGVGGVRINEVLRRNTYSIIDMDGVRSPWLELYNASDDVLDVSEYWLSDDVDEPLMWQIPPKLLAPGEFMLIFLSGKDLADPAGELHTPFRVNSDETLHLTCLKNGTRQSVTPGDGKDNISYGIGDSGHWLFFPQPTPLAPNDTAGFEEIAAIPEGSGSGLFINEVASIGEAKSGDKDWVELYNGTGGDISLEGYSLSDTKNDLGKWPITVQTVEAGEYVLIESYQNGGDSGDLTISMGGEMLYLTAPHGTVADAFDSGVLRPGVSRGRTAGGDIALMTTPTPGEENSTETVAGYCGAPLFSVSGGYHDAPVTLEISTLTESAAIHYTLDGSTPTSDSAEYIGPLIIDETTPVRTVAIKDGLLQSDETAATYLFVDDKHTLPVVCLSMTDSDLRYVFGSKVRQDVRERAGYVEYYEADGRLGVRFPAGFKIAGAGTRTYPQKSINLYLRGGYGMSEVTYPFFEDYALTSFQSLSLRNMGQDTSETRMRDAYCMMAANGLKIDNMQTKFAVVYINGEYWGLYEFKENQNEDYFASRYGADPDSMEMVRSNTYAYVGDNANIKELFSIAAGNMNDEDRWAAFTDRADPEYFMDYIIAQTFFRNSDWYNQKYAHSTDGTMKWHPQLYDLDWGFMGSGSMLSSFFRTTPILLSERVDAAGNPLIGADGQVVRNYVDMGLFYAFSRNNEWRAQLLQRYAEVMNTVFTEERLLALFDEMAESIRGEMPRTIERWGRPSSMDRWEGYVDDMRERIVERREGAKDMLQSYYHLGDEEIATLFPNG